MLLYIARQPFRRRILKNYQVLNMANDSRPLSPHLQVYRWQVTMFLSILHRVTGFGLAAGGVLLTWWLMAAMMGEEHFAQFHEFTHSIIGRLMLLGWLYAYVFHFMNGIRHLIWDTGRGFTIKQASNSAWFVLIASVAGTLAIWCMATGGKL
jgi:succinate dehydrogenase / fumarate reductase cytochrome b subunit